MTAFSKKLRKFIQGILLFAVACSVGCGWINDQWNSTQNPDENASNNRSANGQPISPPGIHLPFGNPSNATPDAANADNYLMVGDGSAFSYNNTRGTINWVSWKTTRADLGESIPRPDFHPDPRLPDGFRRIGPYDYAGSGYDRGHMIPSADRFADGMLNEQTFMTNIVPQTAALNQYPWQKLESYARAQARRGFAVYTIAGVYGDRGTLKGKVTVPTNCWKIIAFLPAGRSADAIDRRTRIVAVDMPNRDGIEKTKWQRYITTIRAIEEKTGLDFFASMPRDLQDRIETRRELSSIKP